jgi:phospholipid/cholesterol/gamma-HCH transport system ATP-binding protein
MSGDGIILWSRVFRAFDGNEVLNDLTLEVQKGETITIIGGSGSGKSVMLKMLLGLMHPDSGEVYFEGRDITRMDEHELIRVRKKMGMLFQGGALFDSLTVGENVAYPLKEHFRYPDSSCLDIARQKLSLVGLGGIEDMKPADLSGGMKKRVALARAIAADPKVILYDEPTTGLDPSNTMRINHLIRDLQQKLKLTSIVVTHDMESAFFVSDRIAMLYNRHIEFVGTPDEARNSNNTVVKGFIRGQVGD